MAICYEKGWGLKKNMQMALKLFEKIGRLGVRQGYKRAGMILSKGIDGLVKPDPKKAKLYFEKASAFK